MINYSNTHNQTSESILDAHYELRMHWKRFNRERVLIAMERYLNQNMEELRAENIKLKQEIKKLD